MLRFPPANQDIPNGTQRSGLGPRGTGERGEGEGRNYGQTIMVQYMRTLASAFANTGMATLEDQG
jgi:hypothetical protein